MPKHIITNFAPRNEKQLKMNYNDEPKYVEWLTVIAKTRLIFNTMGELEDYLDNHNIESNGVKRAFSTPQKVRSAFNDLFMYVDKVTASGVDLGFFMEDYERASKFFDNRLARRSNTEKIASDLLDYLHLESDEHYTKSMTCIFEDAYENDLDESMLVLMLLGALPGYNSKYGDGGDFLKTYNSVVDFFERYTKKVLGEVHPSVTDARYEEVKSRITLYDHVTNILRLIDIMHDDNAKMEEAENARNTCLNFDLNGFWNECGGTGSRTDFWLIRKMQDDNGFYSAVKLTKLQNNTIDMIKYSCLLRCGDDGRVVVFVQHPKSAQKLIITGKEMDTTDRIWYTTAMPDDWDHIKEVVLIRSTHHINWREKITLTRVTDENVIKTYNALINNCQIINKFAKFDYVFKLGYHAITKDAIYIDAEEEGKYYKVPFTANKSLKKLGSNSKIGKIYMDNEIYVTFDDLLLYIPTKKFKEYGIAVVEKVE